MEHTKHDKPNGECSGEERAMADGARIVIDLCRAGANIDEAARALGIEEPDLDAYGERLRQLRAILGTDGLFPGVTA